MSVRPVRVLGRSVGRLLPRAWRLRASAARASALSLRTRARLRRLADSGRPILAGPYFGEVGFELLYWIPFLAWFAERYGVEPGRLIAVSRGGAASWYAHVAAHYCDVFDVLSPAEFSARNRTRIARLGEQKQIEATLLDDTIAGGVGRRLGADAAVLHPSLMYALFAPFWWGHLPISWVSSHVRFRRLTVAPVPETVALPRTYAAVKFYFNDCFEDTPDTRAFVRGAVRDLSQEGCVVSLSTRLTLDDHEPVEAAVPSIVQPGYEARTNLDVQSAIVARAQRFVGTYGGFSYVAPFFGVPSTAYYTDPQGYSQRHLDVARLAIDQLGGGALLDVQPAVRTPAVASRGGAACSSR